MHYLGFMYASKTLSWFQVNALRLARNENKKENKMSMHAFEGRDGRGPGSLIEFNFIRAYVKLNQIFDLYRILIIARFGGPATGGFIS